MDDQVNTQPVPPDYGGILRPAAAAGDAAPPVPFPVEELSKLLSPLGLSAEQTKGVLNCLKETGLRWVMPHMEAAIERSTEFIAQIVKSCFQEVAAGAIHSFGSYAVLCVQRLMLHNQELKVQHQNELAQWKEYATQLMVNLNHQKVIMEAEKKRLEEDLEFAKKRCICGSQTHTHKRGSSKRKGDQVEELEQRQAAKRTGTTRALPQKLNSVLSGLPVRASQTLIQHLANSAPPSMKLPPLEIPPPDINMNDVGAHPVLTNLPSLVPEKKVPENLSEEDAAKEVCVGRSQEKISQFEASPCSAEHGENEKPKTSEGTSGEQSVLTSSHLVEDSQSGANDADEGNILPSPISEKASDEEEPTGKLKKTTSDGHDSSFSTSKQASEEGNNVQSVLADVVDKADTTAALSLCQLGESVVPSETVKNTESGCHDTVRLDVPTTNHIGSNFLQGSSDESEAKKKKKPVVVRAKAELGCPGAVDNGVERIPTRRKPRCPNGDEQRPLPQASPSASDVEAYTSRDQRRVFVVAKQLIAFSERKYG